MYAHRKRFGPEKAAELCAWLKAVRLVADDGSSGVRREVERLAATLGASASVVEEALAFELQEHEVLDVLPIGSGRSAPRLLLSDAAWVARGADPARTGRRLADAARSLGVERPVLSAIEAMIAQERALDALREDLFWNLE
jgi:hypothetical protein